MDPELIRDKFGNFYVASENTYTMGIDQRFTKKIATRFKNRIVLETCTGGGFSTIALARAAVHVFTVEIDPVRQSQARTNIDIAGLRDKVTFIQGDVLDGKTIDNKFRFGAAFLDPDWAVSGPDHVFRFKRSNTQPPADLLLERAFELTENVAIILPPLTDPAELEGLPECEIQRLYMNGSHELFCVYFGDLVEVGGETEYRV